MEQLFIQSNHSFKRAQSEFLDYSLKIISPSPVRSTSKISLSIARELFDLSSLVEENEPHSSLYRTKILNVRKASASDSSNWGSDSSHSSSFHVEVESPSKTNSHNYLIIDSIEEMSPDVVPRASNPIVKDLNFKRCNQEGIAGKFNMGAVIASRS